MWERLEPRFRELARRAGWAEVPPQVLAAACALALAVCVWALWRWWPRGADAIGPVERVAPVVAAPDVGAGAEGGQATETSEPASVCVHVAGAVRRPGVVSLREGARVADAVEAAGGLLPDAVAAAVNLARHVADGEQILVPDEDEVADGTTFPVAAGAAAASGGPGASAMAGPVDVNTADAGLLDTLPGIGPSTAAKIIAERESGGPFASLEDLERVAGIGPKKIEQLDGLACVR